MAAPVYIDISARELPVGPPPRRVVLRSLAMLEARRNLRAPWLWLGIGLSLLGLGNMMGVDYQGGAYQGAMASFAGVVGGIFVLAVMSGSRDRATGTGEPLAPESVLGADDRATARLIGMMAAVAVGALYAAVVFAVSRFQGGYWVGTSPGRTDEALHGPFEVLQPVVLMVVAATVGLALGRATAQRTLVCVLGLLAVGIFGFTYWAWQGQPVVFVAPVQTLPIEVPITWPGGETDLGSIPEDWLLAGPEDYERSWRHLILDQRIAAAHDAYLAGLALVAAGFATGGRRARLIIGVGTLVAVAGVAFQAALLPGG